MIRINMRKSVCLVVVLGVMVLKVHAQGETSTSTTTVVTSSNTQTSSGSKLALEQGAAAMAAREGRELAKEESEGASGLTRREKAEERHLQKEISMSDGSSSSSAGGLSQADRQADAKESRLVGRAEQAEKSAERAEEKAESMLKASGVQGDQKQQEQETSAVLKAAQKAEKAENRAAAEEKRISQETESEMRKEKQEEQDVSVAATAADKVEKYRKETQRDDDESMLAKGIAKKAEAAVNREQARGSEKAAANEQLAVDMQARAESKKEEGNKALMQEATAVVAAESAMTKLARDEKAEKAQEEDEFDDIGPASARPTRKKVALTPAQMKRQAACTGECLRDCKEDCADPEIDPAELKPEECGAECDKDCLEQCSDEEHFGSDRQDEVSDGRPGPMIPQKDDAPPKWNDLDDEDEDEPADGSGKRVQHTSQPLQRPMDLECLRSCTPVCAGECEVDPRDAAMLPSPAMALGPERCKKDCYARCEDDCYIDEGGQSHEAASRHSMPDDNEDDEGDEDAGADDDETDDGADLDKNLHMMLSSCVDSCEGSCMGKCLDKGGLGMLPAQTLDAEELTGMRDKSGQAITPKAIKGHLFCSEGCSGDCFQICEKQVSAQLEAGGARMNVAGGRASGIPLGPAGGRNGGQGRGQGRGMQGRREEAGSSQMDTIVLPAAMHGSASLFSSYSWQIGIAFLCLTMFALACWSGRRMCGGRGRVQGRPMGGLGSGGMGGLGSV